MNSWSITDKGIVRRQNQDAFFACCDETRRVSLLLVCDGMGGAAAGGLASTLAAGAFSDFVMERMTSEKLNREMMIELMQSGLEYANAAVYQKSISSSDMNGMGTTFVAALVTENDAVILNVGDSRAYHISSGKISQITRDHSVVEEMVERGEITREESRVHPSRNLITRALGTAPDVYGDIFCPDIQNGDHILLCSDGLTTLLSDDELLSAVQSYNDMEMCCESMLRQGIARGAPDNITIVLFRK